MLEHAIFYNTRWGVNVVFTNVRKVPLHPWKHLYMGEQSPRDIAEVYRSIRYPAGIAAVASPRARVVFVDVDLYRVGREVDEGVLRRLAEHFVVYTTPRGGVRLVFMQSDSEEPVTALKLVDSSGAAVGEGGYATAHMWHLPPSAACKTEGKCEVGRYEFVLASGKRERYPQKVPLPPVVPLNEAAKVIESLLGVKVYAGVGERVENSVRVREAGETVYVGPPLWSNIEEFLLSLPSLRVFPECVANALGYTFAHGAAEELGMKVGKGARFILGGAAVVFLAATVAEKTAEEVISLAGRNLQDFPKDEGEPLDKKFSRLLARAGEMVVPRYRASFILSQVPPQVCERCQLYRRVCKTDKDAFRMIENYAIMVLSSSLKDACG